MNRIGISSSPAFHGITHHAAQQSIEGRTSPAPPQGPLRPREPCTAKLARGTKPRGTELVRIRPYGHGRCMLDYYIEQDGIRRRHREKFDNVEEAAARAQAIEQGEYALLHRGRKAVVLQSPGGVTVEDCITAWREAGEAQKRHLAAFRERIIYALKPLRAFMARHGIGMPGQWTRSMFDRYVQERTRDGVGLATVRKEYAVLCAAMSHAESRGMIEANPLRNFFRGLRVASHVPDVPSPQDLQKIMDALPCPDARRLFYGLLATGARITEAASLRGEDVSGTVIHFRRGVKFGFPPRVRPAAGIAVRRARPWPCVHLPGQAVAAVVVPAHGLAGMQEGRCGAHVAAHMPPCPRHIQPCQRRTRVHGHGTVRMAVVRYRATVCQHLGAVQGSGRVAAQTGCCGMKDGRDNGQCASDGDGRGSPHVHHCASEFMSRLPIRLD